MDGKVVTLIAQYKGVDGVTLPAKRPLEVRRQNDSGWSLVVFEGHSHWVPTTWLRPSSSGTNRANTTPAKSSAADKVEPVSKAEPESNDTPESEPPQPEEQQPKQRAKEPNTAEDNSKVSPDDATHTTLQGTQSFDDQDDTDDSDDGDDEAFLPSTASPSQTQKPADPAARDDAEPKVSQTWHPLLLRQQLAHITRTQTHTHTLSLPSPLYNMLSMRRCTQQPRCCFRHKPSSTLWLRLQMNFHSYRGSSLISYRGKRKATGGLALSKVQASTPHPLSPARVCSRETRPTLSPLANTFDFYDTTLLWSCSALDSLTQAGLGTSRAPTCAWSLSANTVATQHTENASKTTTTTTTTAPATTTTTIATTPRQSTTEPPCSRSS